MDQNQPPSLPVPPLSTGPGFQPAPPPGSTPNSKKILFGCGGCAVLAIVAFVVFGVFIFFLVTNIIKSTDVYRESVKLAVNSSEVQELIGTPIEEGLVPMGSVETDGASSSANFTVTLIGSKGRATMFVAAKKGSGGQWEYQKLEIPIEKSGTFIDLKPAVLRN